MAFISARRFVSSLPHVLLLLGLSGAAGTARASLLFYSTQAAFTAASTGTSVDTFSGIGNFAALTAVNRTVGDDSYRMWAPSAPGNTGKTNLMIVQSTANPAIAVYYYGVPMVIDSFASADPATPVQALGGNFFNVGSTATYRSGRVTLTALDSDGLTLTVSVTPTYSNATGLVTSFGGFVTTASLVSLTLTPASTSNSAGYQVSVDNLTFGSARVAATATVSEPGSAASLAAAFGAALVAGASRRRRSAPAGLLA